MIRNVFSMFDYISHSVPMEKFHDLGKQNRISIIFCTTIYLKYNILYNTPESFGNRKNVLLISTSLSPFDTELVPLVALVYFTQHVFDPSVCSSVIRLLSPE